ncbi:MAG TPA: HAD-IIB family hydrolase [Armatimonadota bacterium]|nr:HAD-IIB family hydrolase [Armatimonadota bacterium]
MVRLVVLDIDATLVPDGTNIVPHENITAITTALRSGIAVALATTRNFRPACDIARQLNLNLPLICHGGAYIATTEGKVISHTPIDRDVATEIADYADAMSQRLVMTVSEINYLPTFYAASTDAPFADLAIVGSNRQALVGPPTRIATVDEEGSHIIYNRFTTDRRIRISRFYRGSTMYCIGVLHANVTKGSAVQSLCRYLDIDPQETLAMGDSEVDVSMFRSVGYSIAMPHSFDTVKDAASHIAPPGRISVAWGIEQLLSGQLE